MIIEFDVSKNEELNIAFSAGCWGHCCVIHIGWGQDEW